VNCAAREVFGHKVILSNLRPRVFAILLGSHESSLLIAQYPKALCRSLGYEFSLFVSVRRLKRGALVQVRQFRCAIIFYY